MLTSAVFDGTDRIEAVLDGEPDAAAVDALTAQAAEVAARDGGFRVLVEVRAYTDPRSSQVQQALRALGRSPDLRRYAVVSGSAGFRAAAERLLAVVPAEGRVLERRDEALSWLSA